MEKNKKRKLPERFGYHADEVIYDEVEYYEI